MLSRIDANQVLTREDYDRKLVPLQLSFQALAHELYVRRRALIVLFEGWDAAGKGGAIRRLTEQLDARGYEVSPIAAPEGEDRSHHYLYRFWRRLKPAEEKQVQIFDRSWYGRVLVERVEGFCTEEAWKRAYREINDFERQLVSNGMILAKFWLHITPEEQLARFEARQASQSKSWKLNEEDWRNRARWTLYEKAVEEMLLRTSTLVAPWTVVEANDKHFARIKVLKTVVDALEQELSDLPEEKKKNRKS